MPQTILVTGGAGYIGSHTCLELLDAGHEVVVVDNLDNSSEESLRRVQELRPGARLSRGRYLRPPALAQVFAARRFDAVIHFAGLKAVGESCEIPLRYYENNIVGTLELVKAMQEHGCFNLVFSSSATVYGDPATVPITEDFPLSATNPYGRTKLFIEEILRDLCAADDRWRCVLLRYFNPIGAHESGRIGEDPQDIPNNLMPYVMQVAVGLREQLSVFGDDYDTPDGTGVRDYIHVVDLALGHLAAIGEAGYLPGCTPDQPGNRPGLLRSGNGGGCGEGFGSSSSLPGHAPAAGRHRHLLCRSGSGGPSCWAGRRSRDRRDVRRPLAMAGGESAGIPGMIRVPRTEEAAAGFQEAIFR